MILIRCAQVIVSRMDGRKTKSDGRRGKKAASRTKCAGQLRLPVRRSVFGLAPPLAVLRFLILLAPLPCSFLNSALLIVVRNTSVSCSFIYFENSPVFSIERGDSVL